MLETVCGSTDVVLLLGSCAAPHAIDKQLPIGAHQDCKVVSPDIPFSIWVPLHDVVPLRTSGLGFIVPPPNEMLPTLPHGDIGADYVAERKAGAWTPTYRAGDLTLHTKLSPHFTTGYGTRSDRYSFEERAVAWGRCARAAAGPGDPCSPAGRWGTGHRADKMFGRHQGSGVRCQDSTVGGERALRRFRLSTVAPLR